MHRSSRGPSELLFLLREHARTGDAEARDMVLTTLRAMALGGMRDHIGGGFHRYSVDGNWRVPHFEKMLYDQAQLALAYLEAAQRLRRSVLRADRRGHAAIRRGAILPTPEGGFYSAEDADSIPPEQRRRSAWRTRAKARFTSGGSTRSARCSATTRVRSSCVTASCRTATRRSIRRTSSPARICSTRLAASPRSRQSSD